MKATKKILEFKRRLDAYCEQGGFVARQYAGSRRTDNVIGVFAKNGDGTVHILYVKDRSDGEGFWGINTNQVDAFERKGYEWSVVLLIGSGERSYLGSSQLVKRGFSEMVQFKIGLQSTRKRNRRIICSFRELRSTLRTFYVHN